MCVRPIQTRRLFMPMRVLLPVRQSVPVSVLCRMMLVRVLVVLQAVRGLTGMRPLLPMLLALRVSLADTAGRLVRVVEHLAEEQVQGRRCPSAWIGP